ncbi:MAG: UDP-N-acetylmuramate:L-alanyl-gamma-D-glutamyl-meso-diaminopimelate ligase [Deltaproteobacteria bacterium]|nr:UDP-N-acetylmuramate:L-alanyl-gamma-D-glutamyl-meso-diaminopimelate ligase [Deltaproteobacteria bacterium]MBW2051700.1 UDP-N-acetylmuramate:L-alanyl-gamma-D-glutamyl-meso-diaminopimelate ligase [Deltaproteobacteria bacterium]MBW2139971.1 UDP-N-acetylmuramate:L-alanyl-gamma-D-glutamyl-meso-diaminopimelate ligase [Deltaproteobacteria bacterium]MBW2322320.1 UDP-N-acetylmuramate:L-alanyl-gamma-D-glutamyl-meso-diaminopimelate ligase [Deltaproteobacteria bacterium]
MNTLELDPSLNCLPQKAETIHLIGICGTGMGALAGMLVEKGYKVTGSDANVYPPMSEFLDKLSIRVISGYSRENLNYRPDLVVVGNVVTRLNPEAAALAALNLHYLSFPQTLRVFFLAGKRPLVVSGTHGKTTTSALAAWLLETVGKDPGFMIGGILNNYESNYKLGAGDWFVVEGDEYDTAFFDKVPKFIHYAPEVGILTSVEFDHADIYPDLDAIKNAFRRFVNLIPARGLLVACGDDPLVREMAEQASSDVTFYGLGEEGNTWRAADLKADGQGTRFSLIRAGQKDPLPFFSPLPGAHNVLNTLAAAAAMDWIGIKPEKLQKGLTSFKGIHRRQEVRGIEAGVTVIDDFAHHPTEVKQTLAAIRLAYPEARLIAVFEPRTNTSRRKVFQADYASSFDQADEILIREPPGLKKVPAGERFSSAQLVKDLQKKELQAHYFTDTDAILANLNGNLRSGDVVLIMSNGGFDNIHERLLKLLRESVRGFS